MSLDQNSHQTFLDASTFQCMRAGFMCPKCDDFACLHTRQDQNELHLKIRFFAKVGIFCMSIVGPLPSVVQAYTQPYSFGGRIKLIICQIRHEPSVTIYKICTRWKKALDGGPYTKRKSRIFIEIFLKKKNRNEMKGKIKNDYIWCWAISAWECWLAPVRCVACSVTFVFQVPWIVL